MWETIKKAEHRRIDAFELWCWRRLLRVPWTARRSNQSTLKEISPEYSLEGLMLKLKLQYFGLLMRRADSLEKTLMLGKIEGGRRRRQQRMRWLDGTTNSMGMSLRVGDGQVPGSSPGGSRGFEGETAYSMCNMPGDGSRQTGRPGVLQCTGLQRVGHDWASELNWSLLELDWLGSPHAF